MALLDKGFSTDVDSAVLDLKTEFAIDGETVRVDAYGPFESTGPTTFPRMELELSSTFAGRAVDVRLITTAENAFVEYGAAQYEVGRDTWLKYAGPPRDGEPFTIDAMGLEPESWVRDAEIVGSETLSGVHANEVHGTLDLETVLIDWNEALAKYPGGESFDREQLDAVLDEVDEVDFRAWVSDDGILRRLTAGVDFEGDSVSFDLRVEQPNEPVEIRVPSEGAPISELLQILGVPPETLLGPGSKLPVPG